MIYAVGIGTIDVEVCNVSLQVNYVSPQRYSLRSRVLIYVGAADARGYKIVMDSGNISLVMINKRELVRYKVSDLYTLLIRPHSGKFRGPHCRSRRMRFVGTLASLTRSYHF
ncbi:hypothetical protein T10_12747 [Trichinella papuae]|uniref:Retrovirus-related Pol polyprotein from transposon TNT 1-94 n=1 Tax=Trichinella papuae TaxID=268474 RepID=A0A0V1N9I8_9BILA|nr:hypothetical protein T10_12747 [Trichinella papuae]